jgi:V/A-type H+/Na+-transporting ATPase subunit E
MADQIKELIEKIQTEGVQAAQSKAQEIENEAKEKADWILQKANAQAKKIIEDAQDTAKRVQSSGQAALGQTGRDVLLSLKKEIVSMLQRLIQAEVGALLKPEELSKIITSMANTYGSKSGSDIAVFLNDQDKQALEKHFLEKLKMELKKGIELRLQEDIRAGLTISFDNGKSQFDFTDREIANYVGSFLQPAIAKLLNNNK